MHVCVSKDGFHCYAAGTWEAAGVIPGGTDISPLAFARDRRLLALAVEGNRAVRLVDPATGAEYATLRAPNPRQITSLCFSPDGNRLAAGCMTQVIQVWDLGLIRQQLARRRLDW